ncbi:MAG: beta-galactosidase, partial [Muribaculaceae bacterium]|nr:beta-galactosidase [Muribaculaceae bacterium]
MKNSYLPLLLFSLLPTASLAARQTVNFNRDWLFSRADTVGAWQHTFNDASWETVHLPHDFQISQEWVTPSADEKADMDNPVANVKSRLSARGFKETGVGWYRKSFKADPDWKGKRILLDFEGIMLNGDVWLNGHKVGVSDYGYLGFDTDITPYMNWDGDNVISVRADTGRPENSRWYTGGGIYRDVNIIVTDPQKYFARHPLYVTTPDVSPEKATVILQAEITNLSDSKEPISILTEIKDAEGNAVYSNLSSLNFNPKQRQKEYRLD